MTQADINKAVDSLSPAAIAEHTRYTAETAAQNAPMKAGIAPPPVDVDPYAAPTFAQTATAALHDSNTTVSNDNLGFILVAVVVSLIALVYMCRAMVSVGNYVARICNDIKSELGRRWFILFKGKLTVRASTYLIKVSCGATQEEANRIALSIDTYAAQKLIAPTLQHVASDYNGLQAALVSAARLKGFLG